MKAFRFSATIVGVFACAVLWHCVGCGKNLSVQQQRAQQASLKAWSEFAADNDMDLTVLVAHDGRIGVSQDAFIGVDTGVTMNAAFTARASRQGQQAGPNSHVKTTEDALNPTEQDPDGNAGEDGRQ